MIHKTKLKTPRIESLSERELADMAFYIAELRFNKSISKRLFQKDDFILRSEFEEIINICSEFVGSLYFGQQLDKIMFDDFFEKHQKLRRDDIEEDPPYLSGSFVSYLENLAQDTSSYLLNRSFDTIVPIMKGGLETSLIINSQYKGTQLLPFRISKSKKDKKVKVPSFLDDNEVSKLISDKEILVVEDVSLVNGRGVLKTLEFVESFHPSTLSCIVIYGNNHLSNISLKLSVVNHINPTYLYDYAL